MTESPNILFLVLDSMRIDRVSCYGHERETTPNLDNFASQATKYTNAYTPAPWTLPTHTSLFTGLFPSEHGITNAFPDSNLQLSSEIQTLAEKLNKKGYQTAGFSNNPWVGKTSGLHRGFDDYVEWNLEIKTNSTPTIHSRLDHFASRFNSLVGHAARQPVYLLKRPFFTDSLTRRASSWIESVSENDRPWYCFMNLMEAHSPYFPRKRAFRELDLKVPGPMEPRILNTKLLAYIMGKTDLDSETRERLMEFYDASLRYQDSKVTEILSLLRNKNLFDDTLIIICSDHGKTLGDFDRSGHPPHYLRDINTRVPLLVKPPGQKEGDTIHSPIELVSLHNYTLDYGSQPLKNYQPDPKCALFEDYIPHSRRQKTDEEVMYWRGIGTSDKKLIQNNSKDEYVFERQQDDECIVTVSESKKQQLKETLLARVEYLTEQKASDENNRLGDLESDVQAQLEDLGYMK